MRSSHKQTGSEAGRGEKGADGGRVGKVGGLERWAVGRFKGKAPGNKQLKRSSRRGCEVLRQCDATSRRRRAVITR